MPIKMINNSIKVLLCTCILTVIFISSKPGYASQAKEVIKYAPFLNIGEDYTYGSVFVGDPLSENHAMSLEECKEFIKNYAVEMFKFQQERYLSLQKEGKIKDLKNFEPTEINDDNIGEYYFCWPSDATTQEQVFFRKNGYISPQTTGKIFPLGERKYTDELKPTMELIK